jgi:zinc finger protein
MCNKPNLRYNTEVLNLPYFNEVISTTITCDKCSYKYSDILITDQKKPMEHKFKISKIADLTVRVIRSSTSTIELPELGIKIEPASAADAYISNIEGVLVRIISALEQIIKFTEDAAKRKSGEDILDKLQKLRNGDYEVTLIIRDPMGNSSIVSDKVEVRELAPEELEKLKTGMTIIDLDSDKAKIMD